jgi:hypothetical protein
LRALLTVLLGATVFWVPDVLVHAGSGAAFGPAEVLLITMVMPILTLLAYARVDRRGTHTLRGWPRAGLMLVGIWVFGPTFMMISATFGGAGLLGFSTWADWSMLLYVPAVTFILATYDGALGALLLITLVVPCAAALRNRAARARHSRKDEPHNNELQRTRPAQAMEPRR